MCREWGKSGTNESQWMLWELGNGKENFSEETKNEQLKRGGELGKMGKRETEMQESLGIREWEQMLMWEDVWES